MREYNTLRHQHAHMPQAIVWICGIIFIAFISISGFVAPEPIADVHERITCSCRRANQSPRWAGLCWSEMGL